MCSFLSAHQGEWHGPCLEKALQSKPSKSDFTLEREGVSKSANASKPKVLNHKQRGFSLAFDVTANSIMERHRVTRSQAYRTNLNTSHASPGLAQLLITGSRHKW